MTEAADATADRPMVLADRVCKSFGTTQVLKGISLEVHRGEVLCIIGPSGSGKSTFLRCVNHLEEVNAGRLYVDGDLIGYRERGGKLYEMSPKDAAKQRRDIGMVFQHFNLFPHRTVLENVIEAPTQVKRESKADAAKRAEYLLDRVGLADKASSYPAQLSGGQQQMVSVARALLNDNRILLVDEPTKGLAPKIVDEVADALEEASTIVPILLVEQNLDVVRRLATSAVVIAGGRVVHTGPAREILDDEALTMRLLGVSAEAHA